MKKRNPRTFLLPLSIGLTIDKLKKLDERGLLYFMDYKADYYKIEKYVDMVANPGCSTFLTKNENNENIFCRNYDFSHYRFNNKKEYPDVTGLMIVVKCSNKKAKYKSIGLVDAFWLDFAKGRFFEGSLSDGVTNITRTAMAPYVIMDGANDQGVAVSIMHLPTENEWNEIEYRPIESLTDDERAICKVYETSGEEPKRLDYSVKNKAIAINTIDKKSWQANKNLAVNQNDPNKKTLLHPVLMRKMLDYCATVDECINLANSVNVISPLPDNDYHIMVSDKTGKSVILEWVNNELQVVERTHGTNYYLSRDDHYGYGQDRDEILQTKLEKNSLTNKEAMNLLSEVAQNGSIGKYVGFTQWSNIYNLDNNTMDLAIFMDYENIYKFNI